MKRLRNLILQRGRIVCPRRDSTNTHPRAIAVRRCRAGAYGCSSGLLSQGRPQSQYPVLDNTGRTKLALRDDGAAPHSFEHSLRKAYTALTYNMPSGDYGKRAAANPGAIGPQLLANITTAAGGLPIHAGNSVVGAVGVSGTPGSAGGGEADSKCGQAGIDRIAKGLTSNR